MLKLLSMCPSRASFLNAKDLKEAFQLLDSDGSHLLKGEELKETFDAILPDNVVVDAESLNGVVMNFKTFRTYVERLHMSSPKLNVAGNLMQYVKERRTPEDDDDEAVSQRDLQGVFSIFDRDGSGEMNIGELFVLARKTRLPPQFIYNRYTCTDGSLTFPEFSALLKMFDSQAPWFNVGDKIATFCANHLPDSPPEDDEEEEEESEDGVPDDMGGKKKALLVGINYVGQSAELNGCINDVRKQKSVLMEHFGFGEEDILLLTEDQDDDSKMPTAENIRGGLDWLLGDAGEDDLLVFHYSGHGSNVADKTNSEKDGRNECLIPVDFDWGDKLILDDELYKRFYVDVPEGVRVVCIYDCCHSGTMSDLCCTRALKLPGDEEELSYRKRFLSPPSEFEEELEGVDGGKTREVVTENRDIENKMIWSVSGCQDHQTSADATIGGVPQGAMSWALFSTLEDKNYRVSYSCLLDGMRAKLRGRYTQIPGMATARHANFQKVFLTGPTA